MHNQIYITGFVGADGEVNHTTNGTAVMKLNVATSKESTKGNVITQWHRVIAWNHLAGIVCKKGDLVHVVGEVTYRKYKDKDNVERSITEVVAYNLYKVDRPSRETSPPLTEDDMPPLPGAQSRMNSAVVSFDNETPFLAMDKDLQIYLKNKSLPPLTDQCYMPIGKHAGKKMKDIPVEYYAKLVDIHCDAPRVFRGEHWIRVMNYIRSFKDKL